MTARRQIPFKSSTERCRVRGPSDVLQIHEGAPFNKEEEVEMRGDDVRRRAPAGRQVAPDVPRCLAMLAPAIGGLHAVDTVECDLAGGAGPQ